jgi:signal transduction histidine kinase
MRRFVARLTSPHTWRETAHLLLDLAVGVALFTWVVTMLSLGVGLAITVIGIPLLALSVMSGRWIGAVERGRVRLLLGDDLPEPLPFDPPAGLWPRIRAGLGDRAGWKGLAYGLIMLPWGIVTFTVTVVVWSVAVGLTTLPLFDWALPDGGFEWGSYRLTGLGLVGAYALTFAVGVGSLAVAPTIVHAMADGDRRLARLLLTRGPNEMLERRVTQLQQSRDASVESSASELRRIERDLHDGAQQRLVSLAMNLGIAKERLEASDDPRAAELVGRAHDDAKQAIAELRDLVRGIHPAVLTDLGLDAAVSALAARCPVPVALDVDVPRRLPSPIEAAAYFVVAEALTNVAKHSDAQQAIVRLHERERAGSRRLIVEVHDDGRGGASAERGSGLRGLHDRVVAVEGSMALNSPVGGPTSIVVELPCGS